MQESVTQTITITNWHGETIATVEAADTRDAIQKLVAGGANLGGAYLGGAYLGGANLGGANLGGANLGGAYLGGAYLGGAYLGGANLGGAYLGGAYLGGAYLGGAYLGGANLGGAYLGGANLGGANLGGAYLGGAYLGGAYLGGANLGGANLNWNSHDLIGELLFRAAGGDIDKRKVAGLILISRDWCWRNFLALHDDPLFDWALDTLAAYVRDNDGAPDILRRRAATKETA